MGGFYQNNPARTNILGKTDIGEAIGMMRII
jgi:hypothetical protein